MPLSGCTFYDVSLPMSKLPDPAGLPLPGENAINRHRSEHLRDLQLLSGVPKRYRRLRGSVQSSSRRCSQSLRSEAPGRRRCGTDQAQSRRLYSRRDPRRSVLSKATTYLAEISRGGEASGEWAADHSGTGTTTLLSAREIPSGVRKRSALSRSDESILDESSRLATLYGLLA
jgi:hypothetical protein